MLAKIEAGGETVALAYGRDLDGYAGDAIVSDEVIAAAAATVSPQLKDDIQFAYDRVTRFAKAQLASLTAILGFGNRLQEKGGKPPKGGRLMMLPWQMFGRFLVTGRGDAIY